MASPTNIKELRVTASAILEGLVPLVEPEITFRVLRGNEPIERMPPTGSPSETTRQFQCTCGVSPRRSNWSQGRKTQFLIQKLVFKIRYQIPLREIIQAVQARNIRMTGGTFESYTSEKNVVTLAQFRNPAE